MLKRYQQGDLDGLCGIYAVVNGINHLLQIKVPQRLNDDLFQIVAGAIPKKNYPQVLWEGLDVDQLARIARKTSSYLMDRAGFRIEVTTPFDRRRFKHRDQFFDAIDEIWAVKYAVFVLFIEWPKTAGGGAHWSVLREIRDDHVRLIDSDGQPTLSTKRLHISGDKGTRIVPARTLMLCLSGVDGEPVAPA